MQTDSIGFDEFDPLMMEPKWNITQASWASKAQAIVYKIEVSKKFWSVSKLTLICLSDNIL